MELTPERSSNAARIFIEGELPAGLPWMPLLTDEERTRFAAEFYTAAREGRSPDELEVLLESWAAVASADR